MDIRVVVAVVIGLAVVVALLVLVNRAAVADQQDRFQVRVFNIQCKVWQTVGNNLTREQALEKVDELQGDGFLVEFFQVR